MNYPKIYYVVIALLLVAVAMPAFAQAEESEVLFDDGRINHSDAAAPVAVYGDGQSLEIWSPLPLYGEVQTENGEYIATHPILIITAEEISGLGLQPETNTLIAATENMSIALYRLTTGEYQLNAITDKGEMYTLIFPELYAHTGYASYFSK